MISVLILGKNAVAEGQTETLPIVSWLEELRARKVCALIELTQRGETHDRFSAQLATDLEIAGIDYFDLADAIPDNELIRDALFDELFTAEEKLLYQVPVRFDQFCLHELPIAIYNFALRYPDRPVALLLEDAELSDKLRIHFARSVAKNDIQGLDIYHLYPVKQAKTGAPLSFLQISNESLNPYWQLDYEQIIARQAFRRSLSEHPALRPLNVDDLLRLRPALKDIPATIHLQPRTIPQHYFMLNYVPYNKGGSEISNKIIRFKNGAPDIVQDFAAGLVEALLMRELAVDYIIRALGSAELTAGRDRPLDRVGQTMAEELGIPYRPELIRKTRVITPLKTLKSAVARDLELRGVYEANPADIDYNGQTILVLDDIYTRGTTFKAIEQALLARWPEVKVFGHFLARTV